MVWLDHESVVTITWIVKREPVDHPPCRPSGGGRFWEHKQRGGECGSKTGLTAAIMPLVRRTHVSRTNSTSGGSAIFTPPPAEVLWIVIQANWMG